MNIRNPKNNDQYMEDFIVDENGFIRLLGAKTAQKMQFQVIQNILHLDTDNTETPHQQNTDSLTENEVLSDCVDLTEVNGIVTPVVMATLRVPVAVKGKLREDFELLEGLRVLTKEDKPTAWVSGLAATMKPSGEVRVCIDPQRLNIALKRRHYPLPVVEEVLQELAKAKVFSKADLKDGFLQIQLEVESSKLTTFQTPWGRYYYYY